MHIRDRITEFRRVRAGDLVPNPKNWRKHPESQQNALRGVLAEIGYADAIIVRELPDGRLMIVDGHLRAETTPDQMVPVLVVDLTEAEADKLLATLDPLAAMATADPGKLDALLREIQTESEAVAAMLTDLAESNGILSGSGEVVEDEVPEPPADPVTKPGDLWLLGEHKLLCGDSTKAEDAGRVIGGELADICFTSPPYGQQREYDNGGVGDWDTLMCGVFGNLPMTDAGQVLVNLGLVHRDGEWVPYWDVWIDWMREHGWRRFGWYVWDQGPGLPGDWNGRFAPSHEFVFHFNKKSVRPQKSKPCKWAGSENHGSGLRASDNTVSEYCHAGKPVQHTKIPDSVIRVSRHKARGIEVSHPAVFSVGFASEIITSWAGLVFDPFLGSGTTLIAAEQLHRRCFGIEISPAYCDVIVTRWEKLTGKKAKREKPAKTKRKRQKAAC